MNLLLHIIADSSPLSPICPKTGGSDSYCGLPTPTANPGTVHEIFQIVLGILGGVALLVIVIAGLRFITSAGDPQKAAHARTTIIFALLGLIIAIAAYSIITFIIKRL
jgi:hypothetical protein